MVEFILTANVQIMTANGIKGEIILWAMFSRREKLWIAIAISMPI